MSARDAIERLRQDGLDHEADVAADALFEAEEVGSTIAWYCQGDPFFHFVAELDEDGRCPLCGAPVVRFD